MLPPPSANSTGIKQGIVPQADPAEEQTSSENCVYLNPGAFEGAKDGDTVKFQGEGIYHEGADGPQVEVTSINNQPVAKDNTQGDPTAGPNPDDLAGELSKLQA